MVCGRFLCPKTAQAFGLATYNSPIWVTYNMGYLTKYYNMGYLTKYYNMGYLTKYGNLQKYYSKSRYD